MTSPTSKDWGVLIETAEHGLFTRTWPYENNKIVDHITIRPCDQTIEDFLKKQVVPWGKSRTHTLPAMIAEGTEIILEDILFADVAPTA